MSHWDEKYKTRYNRGPLIMDLKEWGGFQKYWISERKHRSFHSLPPVTQMGGLFYALNPVIILQKKSDRTGETSAF